MMANYAGAKVEVVLPNVYESVGEGPHWDEDSGCLICVDIGTEQSNGRSALLRWHSKTGQVDKIPFNEDSVSAIIPRKSGGYVVCLNRKLVSLDWESKKMTTLVEIENRGTKCRFNDAKCDPAGRVWAGSMGFEPKPAEAELKMGVLGCLHVDGHWQLQVENVDISNGMAWSSDKKTMYYIDSLPRKVYAFDYDDAAGTICNQRVAVDFSEVEKKDGVNLFYPDGCCIDADDNLWVACFKASKVVHFNPRTGEKLGEIPIPTQHITSCCFGGPGYSELFVTCGRRGVTDEQFRTSQPTAGSLFKVTGLGVKGLPPSVYLG